MRIRVTRETVQDYLMLTLGTLLTAVGVYFFKFPNHFSTGGVSGLSIVLGHYMTSTPGAIMFLINQGLLVLGFVILGGSFGIRTAYTSLVLSGATWALEYICPLSEPMTSQPLLELIFAVGLPAVGSAIMFNMQASSGGTDIIAMILRKYTSMNIGTALMIADSLITVAALFFFGVEAGLYSILGLLMKSTLVDYVGDSFRTKKCFQIITDNPQPIINFIVGTLHRSATLEDVHGAYTNTKKTMIVTVMNRAQALALRKHVHVVDPHAFMIITASTEIVGKGFLKN